MGGHRARAQRGGLRARGVPEPGGRADHPAAGGPVTAGVAGGVMASRESTSGIGNTRRSHSLASGGLPGHQKGARKLARAAELEGSEILVRWAHFSRGSLSHGIFGILQPTCITFANAAAGSKVISSAVKRPACPRLPDHCSNKNSFVSIPSITWRNHAQAGLPTRATFKS